MEVLLALSVIAIALTALLKATSQNVTNTERIKEKTLSHWVARQGITLIQTGLLTLPARQETTQSTTLLGETWYWRAKTVSTPIKSMEQIVITVSKNQAGPFKDPLVAFRFAP